MKKLKIGIFVIIMLIIAIVLSIIIITNKSKKEEEDGLEKIYATEEEGTFEGEEGGFEEEKDILTFFSLENYVKDFIEYLDENNEETGKEESLLNILNPTYLEENQINKENVMNKLKEFNKGSNFNALNIKSKYSEDVYIYIIKGLQYAPAEKINNVVYIIYLDSNNDTYNIIPIAETKDEDIEKIAVKYKKDKIKENEKNSFKYISQGANQDNYTLCIKKYFEFFDSMILNYPELIYNDYFENEYKEKRFGSLDKFKEYIKKNEEELSNITPSQYDVKDETEGKEQFLCVDQYSNYYEIYQNSIMNFKIRLDTYTMRTDKFEESYNSSKDDKKVQMNIDKWVQMLNARDYESAYEKLDETFRNTNFDSEEKFEQYMREKYPYHYGIEFNKESKEGEIYNQAVKLTEITGSEEENIEASINIVMKLEDEYNYTMSFEILE